jgi:anti-sigma factor RsiW
MKAMGDSTHCRRIRKRLSAYQDGELSPAERERVRAHLEGCPACREKYEELEQVWQSLGELGEIRPTPGFYSRLVERIEEQQKGGLFERLRWALYPFPAALPTPAVLIVGLLVGVYLANLLVTGNVNPLRPRPGSSPAAVATLASLRAFDSIPPGTLGEGYLRAACDPKDGQR